MVVDKKIKHQKKKQTNRLSIQHEVSGGVTGIFGKNAREHDSSMNLVSLEVLKKVQKEYPHLTIRKRTKIQKEEIHRKLQSLDKRLGRVLFVKNSSIRPDGGIIEVKDIDGDWRIILVGESKHQGNDVEKIKLGIKQGKNKDQDLMVAGNAIERVHKNILEIRNMMIDESYFPYVVFLQGTNFATETKYIKNMVGKKIKIGHDMGSLNRIDRVTASNYGMEINTNHCKGIEVGSGINHERLRPASPYFQCEPWSHNIMFKVMLEIAQTSLGILQHEGSLLL